MMSACITTRHTELVSRSSQRITTDVNTHLDSASRRDMTAPLLCVIRTPAVTENGGCNSDWEFRFLSDRAES